MSENIKQTNPLEINRPHRKITGVSAILLPLRVHVARTAAGAFGGAYMRQIETDRAHLRDSYVVEEAQ